MPKKNDEQAAKKTRNGASEALKLVAQFGGAILIGLAGLVPVPLEKRFLTSKATPLSLPGCRSTCCHKFEVHLSIA